MAVLLLVLPGPLGVAVAVVALLLMVVYLVLVIRALRGPVDVDCACFGALGGDRVSAGTVRRNAWLTAVAALTVWGAVDSRSVIGHLVGLDGTGWWWLASVVGAVVTTGLVTGAGGRDDDPTIEADAVKYVEDEGDYVRYRTPAVPVLLGDGSTTDLRTLSAQRAQLLVFVSEGCAPCLPVIDAVPRWREEMPMLDIRYVVQFGPEVARLTSAPDTIHDVDGHVKSSFDTRRTPSAILLGADGLLAGGPVTGGDAVPDFVAEIREQLGG